MLRLRVRSRTPPRMSSTVSTGAVTPAARAAFSAISRSSAATCTAAISCPPTPSSACDNSFANTGAYAPASPSSASSLLRTASNTLWTPSCCAFKRNEDASSWAAERARTSAASRCALAARSRALTKVSASDRASARISEARSRASERMASISALASFSSRVERSATWLSADLVVQEEGDDETEDDQGFRDDQVDEDLTEGLGALGKRACAGRTDGRLGDGHGDGRQPDGETRAQRDQARADAGAGRFLRERDGADEGEEGDGTENTNDLLHHLPPTSLNG